MKPHLAPGWLQHWLFWLARGKVRLHTYIAFSETWRVQSDNARASPALPSLVCPTWDEGMDTARPGASRSWGFPTALPRSPSSALSTENNCGEKSANSSAQSPKPGCAPKRRVNKRYSQLGRLLITWWKHFSVMQLAALNNLLEKKHTLLPS